MRETNGGVRRPDALKRGVLAAMLICALAAMVSACTSVPVGPEVEVAAYSQPGTYRIVPGDRLRVTVFGEEDLSGEFQVANDGTLSLPLVGETRAAGQSPDAVRAAISGNLVSAGFMRDPKVAVEVVSYRPFNVFGEVRDAGQYEYRPGMTVRDAVALAGGYTYRANKSFVYIENSGADREVKIPTDGATLYIHPGDSLRIPERFF